MKSKKKEAILVAGLQLFAENGYENVTMDDIKDKAKVAKGTLYYHFMEKRELYVQVCDYFFKQVEKYIDDSLNKDEKPKKRFINAILLLIDYIYKKMNIIHMLFSQKHKNIKDFSLLKQMYGKTEQALMDLGYSQGEAELLTPIINSMWLSFFTALKSGYLHKKDVPDFKKKIAEILHSIL